MLYWAAIKTERVGLRLNNLSFWTGVPLLEQNENRDDRIDTSQLLQRGCPVGRPLSIEDDHARLVSAHKRSRDQEIVRHGNVIAFSPQQVDSIASCRRLSADIENGS